MKFRLLIAVLLSTHLLIAQDWTGAVNSDWNNSANWSNVPQNGDNITISTSNYTGAMAHPIVANNSIFSPAEVAMDGGAVLTVSANLTTTDRVEVTGNGTAIIVNTGTLSISGGAGNARLIFSDGSHLEVNGGTLNVGQRLLFELGAFGELNAGTIDIAETFALIDGNATASSSFVQNGGFLVTDEFGFENEAGNYFPAYRLFNGTLNIVTAFLVEGAAPASGSGLFHATGGTTNLFGTLGNLAGSTMNFIVRLEDDALFNMTGSAIDQLAGDSIVVTNGGTLNIGSTLNWQNAGVLTGENADVFVNGIVSLNGNGIYQFPNATVALNKTLNQLIPNTLFVNGNFNLFGSYNQLSHTLELNGNTLQLIHTPAPLTLANLIVNNSEQGVEIDNDLTISTSLKWEDGILNLTQNELFFESAAVSLTPSENSYAIGSVSKRGSQAFEFPVGASGNRYRPVVISAPATASTEIRVNYVPAAYSSLNPVETPLQSVSALEFWDISRTGSTDFVTVSVAWNNAAQSGLVDCASVSLSTWNGSQWDFVPSSVSGICSGTGAGSLTSGGNIEHYGPFTIGFTEGVYQQQVEVCYGGSVQVGANTYDTSGVYYDVFQDVNGDDSIVVTVLTVNPELNLAVQNNTISLTAVQSNANYTWLDCSNGYTPIPNETGQTFFPVVNGTYAVRIEQNSCVDTSDCYVINELSLNEAKAIYLIYPNPVAINSLLTIQALNSIESVSLYTSDGKELQVYQGEGSSKLIISVTDLAPGIYFLGIRSSDSSVKTERLLVVN